MADQGKWFKLWLTSVTDPDLEDLTLENWARWARLGVFIKGHGDEGQIEIKDPARALQHLLRVQCFSEVLHVVSSLPGYEIEEIKSETANETVNETVAIVSYKIKCRNWSKYQGDLSTSRVKRHRLRETVNETANVTVQEEKRIRREEKRNISVSRQRKQTKFTPPTPQEVGIYANSIGFAVNANAFCDYYAARGWRWRAGQMKDWKAAVRTWKHHAADRIEKAQESTMPAWMAQ
jgi:hypothetical protein